MVRLEQQPIKNIGLNSDKEVDKTIKRLCSISRTKRSIGEDNPKKLKTLEREELKILNRILKEYTNPLETEGKKRIKAIADGGGGIDEDLLKIKELQEEKSQIARRKENLPKAIQDYDLAEAKEKNCKQKILYKLKKGW